jgi:hypothetical protein
MARRMDLTCLACPAETSTGLVCDSCTRGGIVAYRYPARPWTLNAERRDHWSQSRALTREWREAFAWLAIRQRRRFTSCHVLVVTQMRSPVQDTGNAYGAAKAAIDGLVDAGVLPGDGPEVIRSITFLAPTKVGKDDPEYLAIVLSPD